MQEATLTKYAIDYLSKYSSSKKNLERILTNKIRKLKLEKKDKFYLYQSINKIIIKLEDNNLISDSNYSYAKIKSFILQGKSKIYITSHLIQKGVDKYMIADNFEKIYLEDPEWEENSAKIFVRKKNLNQKLNSFQKNLAKMGRAGFSYDLSKKILENN
jgi:SOS response regulatory protein OraA/RecX|tara:strand:+ start:848 stop:1324 length:477 start_codon:yes stop_codon:yes gene_type:complete